MSQKSVEACKFCFCHLFSQSCSSFVSLFLPSLLIFHHFKTPWRMMQPYSNYTRETGKHIQSFWNQTTLAIFNLLHLFWLHSQIENLICLTVFLCLCLSWKTYAFLTCLSLHMGQLRPVVTGPAFSWMVYRCFFSFWLIRHLFRIYYAGSFDYPHKCKTTINVHIVLCNSRVTEALS